MTTTATATETLFTPTRVGAIAVKNRIAMAPLTRSRAGMDGVPSALAARYYAERASAGLLGPVHAHFGDRVARPGGWMQGARAPHG